MMKLADYMAARRKVEALFGEALNAGASYDQLIAMCEQLGRDLSTQKHEADIRKRVRKAMKP
jgi:hypothetical protein